mgnify:CR=1 FL=1
MDGADDDIERRVDKLEGRVQELRDFQKMVMGGIAAVGALLAFMADYLRKKLGFG